MAAQAGVPGVKNCGNTCYLGSTLQALASCSSVLRHLEDALAMLSDHAPPTSTSKAAGGGGLTPQLLACLNALQPQPNFAALRSVSPRLLLDALRARAPAGALSAGLEHDAAEALELLCDLVAEDLQAAFACGAWQHLVKQASLASVLDAAGGGPALASAAAACNGSSALLAGDGAMQQRGAEEGQPPGRAGSSLPGLSDGYNTDSTSSNTDDLVPPVPAPQPRPGSAAGRVAQTDRLLSAWQQHAWLPLRGANAHELSCVRCKHRSTVQLSPFTVLPLGIAVAPSAMLLGNVPAAVDASLEGSLAAFYGYEAVRGWHCTRCCLAASLDAAADDLPPQQQRLRQMLADGGQFVESETYSGLLAAAGLRWINKPCLAAKRTVAARLPLVLCLQLRRGFWSDEGHHVKVTGPVHFSMCLPLPRHLVPLLGHDWAGGGTPAADEPPLPPMYDLRAVIVHLGGLAGGGHYLVYRCLDAPPGHGTGSRSGTSWVCASDEAVRNASVQEVLKAEASILLYERRTAAA